MKPLASSDARYLLIGTKRFNSEKSGDREVQSTVLELLN
jgi:ATP-dependent 26S proteasome regulatory subunit